MVQVEILSLEDIAKNGMLKSETLLQRQTKSQTDVKAKESEVKEGTRK